MSVTLDRALSPRGPRWSLAHELEYLGHAWIHVEILGGIRLARWVSPADCLTLLTTLDTIGGPVYLTLHNSTPVGRSSPFEFGRGNWLCSKDISQFSCVPFDCDPVRAHGVKEAPTTQAEHERGAQAAIATWQWLLTAGCPEGALGMMCSGNGFWVLLRCAIENTPLGEALVQGFLQRWAAELGPHHPDVVLDTGNYDPKRIGPYIGLTKRKGVESDDRPYRRSYWITGDASVVLSATDVQTLLSRLGGVPAAVRECRSTEYVPGWTERELANVGYERVFDALGLSPKYCQWCAFDAGDTSTVEILSGTIQCCLRGTCRSAGHNARPLARVISKALWDDDDWRAHETDLQRWMNAQFGTDLMEDSCCF